MYGGVQLAQAGEGDADFYFWAAPWGAAPWSVGEGVWLQLAAGCCCVLELELKM